jgi:hypothetical protein
MRKHEADDVERVKQEDEGNRLLSVRSALVLSLAFIMAAGGACLLYAAHRPVPMVALGSAGIFATAIKLIDSLIE